MFSLLCSTALALAAPPPLAAQASQAPTATPAPSTQPRTARPPNVIFIMIDDLGWQDVGFMGSTYYRTPNIDALARRSTVFTDGYAAAPNCAPTRAALFSGQSAPRTGIYTVGASDRGPANGRKLIPVVSGKTLSPRFTTLAEAFKANGYTTASVGKWHLGPNGEAGPREQGFDVNVAGDDRGAPSRGGYFAPYSSAKNGRMPGLETAPAGEYLTDRLTTEAIGFMTQNRDKPFFLYLSHYGVHTPLEAKPGSAAPWETVPPDQRQGQPTYAAMVASVDDSVGAIAAAVARLGLTDDTIIVFTSDNGGYSDATYAPRLRGQKGTVYEGGIRVPFFIHAPKAPAATVATPVITTDMYPTLLDLAGLKKPAGVTLDGNSVAGSVRTGKTGAINPLFWHFPVYLASSPIFANATHPVKGTWRARPVSVIRDGRWKLHENLEDGSTELYDLSTDLSEDRNVAKLQPAVARRLLDRLHAWQKSTGAPIPTALNPAYDPMAKPAARRRDGGEDES